MTTIRILETSRISLSLETADTSSIITIYNTNMNQDSTQIITQEPKRNRF